MLSCSNDRVTPKVNRCDAVVASSQSEQWNRHHRHGDGHGGQSRAQRVGDRWDGYH